ncbi:MAG: hypothetical protein MZV64_18790 [Ignavibacteriales bacterium]|nr:hypothetical protein [Ignavibacteriales bacterium]
MASMRRARRAAYSGLLEQEPGRAEREGREAREARGGRRGAEVGTGLGHGRLPFRSDQARRTGADAPGGRAKADAPGDDYSKAVCGANKGAPLPC